MWTSRKEEARIEEEEKGLEAKEACIETEEMRQQDLNKL